MVEQWAGRETEPKPVSVVNGDGPSPYLIVCEHASHYIPAEFAGLGLDDQSLRAHIAWDPGAVEVARHLSQALDAALVESCLSRLIIDCNRPLDAPDLIPYLSENTSVPGNQDLSESQKQQRIALSHQPLHAQIEQLIAERTARNQPSWLVTIHSFTPVYRGAARPWQIGIIHDADARLAAPMIAELRKDTSIQVGVNEPYSPDDRVYYTLERHARNRDAYCAMVEIRNDEIAHAATQKAWADRLAVILSSIEPLMHNGISKCGMPNRGMSN